MSKCPLLRSISFGGTPIVEIDLSKNLMLTSADAYNANQLKKVYLTEGQTIESSMGISDFIVYLPYEASEDAVALHHKTCRVYHILRQMEVVGAQVGGVVGKGSRR